MMNGNLLTEDLTGCRASGFSLMLLCTRWRIFSLQNSTSLSTSRQALRTLPVPSGSTCSKAH